MDEERKNKGNQIISEHESCFHCGLPVKKGYSKDSKNFCCNGCITAYELISSFGADSYYQNRTNQPEKPVGLDLKSFPYQSQTFKDNYIDSKNGLNTITLYLENIHCPSCIWVIEKVTGGLNGVKEISLNFTTHRLRVSWDEKTISLKNIIDTLAKIGYPASPVEKNDLTVKIDNKNKKFLMRLIVSFFGMMSTMFLSEPFYFIKSPENSQTLSSYLNYVNDLDNTSAHTLKLLSLLISTPIFFYCIKPFLKGFLTSLKYKVFTMDFTISLGALLIYIFSIKSSITNKGNIYFDCLNMFLFLIILGRYIESLVQQNIINKSVISAKSFPKQATIIKNEQEILIHSDELNIDDVVLVKSGEQVPADGIITYGISHVSESVLTGESKPVNKREGDTVLSGSVNLKGSFYFRVTKIGSQTNLNQIINLIQNIGSGKNHLQTFTDKFSNIFISSVILLALVVYLLNFKNNPDYALLTAISIIVVTCPCALGLATPVAVSLACSSGVKKGILFKSTDSFEKITDINHVVFDKTGTLTSGKMSVIRVYNNSDYSESDLMEIASSIERYSEHPIAWSIVKEANTRKLNLKKATNYQAFSGKGVKGNLDNTDYFIGNELFIKENNLTIDFEYTVSDSETIVFISNENKVLGYFILKDEIRKDAFEVISYLKAKNIEISILSGDRKEISEDIAKQLDIKNVISEVLPKQKLDYIQSLQNQGYKVAMAGDGINDTPAMKQSDIAIAICPNNDLANINSDILVLNNDFSSFIKIFEISDNTFTLIKQNLQISLVYNLMVIPFAATGYISPLIAAVLMPCSSMLVLLNSLQKSWSNKL